MRIFDTPDEAIAHLSTLDDPAGHQLEEFVEGPLLHADALVVEGIPQHATVSTYSGRPVDFPAGVPLGSTQVPVSGDHLDYIAAVVAALGITVGAMHLEFFDTDRGFVFLEAANRVGGGGIIEAHRLHTGIHLPTHEIRVRLGLAAPDAEPASGSYHAFVMFPPPDRSPGELVAVVPDDLARHPFVRAMHINTARPHTNSDTTYQEWEVPLFVEAEHRSSEELLGFVDDLLTRVRIDRRVAA
ncbi:hypothetical protein ACFWNH_30380 [Rhodococcus qingshengii]|uniref:hypothetical protein n=1 Tax=Rhodococcus qingshengii TaxID=334542 RepID=UPI0036585033